MSEMYAVSEFLQRFGNSPELIADLIALLDIWQQVEEHGFMNQALQHEANTQVQMIRTKYGLSADDIIIIDDNEEAFRAHLSHPSRPQVNKELSA